jgi:hypothetical protein
MIHGLASIKYWNRVSEIVTEVAAEHGVFPKHEAHVEAALGAMKPLHNAHYWDWYLEAPIRELVSGRMVQSRTATYASPCWC